jgi:SAM-dependent methyltransferase
VPAYVHFDAAREEAELRAYLGQRYDHARLQRYQDTLDEEFARCGDEHLFYRTSEGYLYNLTAFAMTGTKLPYLAELTRGCPPGSRLLDYGCGIGSDGLMLLEAGYRVEFAEFDNPSSRYLRWRLERRGLAAPVHDLDRAVPDGFDAAYAFDVIEHVDDPFGFLAELESRARLVVVNFLEPEPDDQPLHYELPIPDLIEHAVRRRLLRYRVFHGRSHLVMYSPRSGSRWSRVVGRTRVGTGRARKLLSV